MTHLTDLTEKSPDGEIGRRTVFRSQRPQGCAGADEAKLVSMLTVASAFESSSGRTFRWKHLFLMQYFVYILYSENFDKYYIGQANNTANRLARHNAGYEKATAPYIPWNLLWFTEKSSRAEAMQLEKKLKNLSKDRIRQFIQKYK